MILIANWKAYVEDMKKAKELVSLSKRLTRDSEMTIVIAPPAAFMGSLAHGNKSSVCFAAQDVSATTGGAKTGEVTAQTYAAAGALYAIVGHSERRAMGDTDTIVAEKVSHALAHGLTPVLCIGENERDNEGRYLSIVRSQLTTALAGLTPKECKKVIIAYEPVWAIGKSADNAIEPGDLAEMVLYIRKVLSELLPGKSSAQSIILYGGSVEIGNVRGLAGSTGVDGFLVGHASVSPKSFAELARELS